jgi:hypothetical protein
LSPRTRTLRYGAAIAVALVGVACGAIIPGTAGGTAATVLVGIGLVGIVSLIFYEVGLTEDRDRASAGRRGAAEDGSRQASDAAHDDAKPPRPPGTPGEHDGGRIRRLERRRGQRRRLR